jgi:hypothetical protein
MPRAFTRDELLQSLRIIEKMLTAFPAAEYASDEPSEIAPVSRRTLPADGAVITDATQPTDGSTIKYGWAPGQPQPPRKQFTLAPKVKPEKIDLKALGFPRAARRIVELLAKSEPLTSHSIMQQLDMARPTWQNAMTKLRKKNLIVSVGIHDGR